MDESIKINENVKFIRFNNEDIDHISAIDSMLNDEEIIRRTGPLCFNVALGKKDAFLVEINGHIVGTVGFNLYVDECYIACAILQAERRRGYLTTLLKAIPNYVFINYPNVKSVLEYIEKDNEGSIRGAISAGYQLCECSKEKYVTYCYSYTMAQSRG